VDNPGTYLETAQLGAREATTMAATTTAATTTVAVEAVDARATLVGNRATSVVIVLKAAKATTTATGVVTPVGVRATIVASPVTSPETVLPGETVAETMGVTLEANKRPATAVDKLDTSLAIAPAVVVTEAMVVVTSVATPEDVRATTVASQDTFHVIVPPEATVVETVVAASAPNKKPATAVGKLGTSVATVQMATPGATTTMGAAATSVVTPVGVPVTIVATQVTLAGTALLKKQTKVPVTRAVSKDICHATAQTEGGSNSKVATTTTKC